ncbi:multimerin-2-like [Saccostrea cucullata]|uniref:multimerin-2-like n=1 Tax=Saccostrea cuccullata TaxID=36930 RepID=UPI002ED389F2
MGRMFFFLSTFLVFSCSLNVSIVGSTEVVELRREIRMLEQRLQALEVKINNTSTNRTLPIAFTACLGTSLRTLGPQQRMEFNEVILNEGGAYDPRHGIFRAPATGIYRFVVTFINKPYLEALVEIVKDGILLSRAYSDYRQHSEGTVQVNVKLQSGEDVWCRNAFSSKSIILHPDGKYTCFSGFQIL